MIFDPLNSYGPMPWTANTTSPTPTSPPTSWSWLGWTAPEGRRWQPNQPKNPPINGTNGGMAQPSGQFGILGPQLGAQGPMTGTPPNFNFDLNDPRLRPMLDPFPMPSMPQPTGNQLTNMSGLRGILSPLGTKRR